MSHLLAVAVPGPFREPLHYLAAADGPLPAVGCRVSVPLGRRQLVGVVLAHPATADVEAKRLRAITACLDAEPILDADILRLARWAADYYHHPIGEVISRCLPPRHRRRGPPPRQLRQAWQLTAAGQETDPARLQRTPAQARALAALQASPEPRRSSELEAEGIHREILRKLEAAGLVMAVSAAAPAGTGADSDRESPLTLNDEQQQALTTIEAGLGCFAVHLLDGITGSGKTEVYLRAMARTLDAGRQVLMLVPEIGLTPQTEQRLRRRFGPDVATLHSAMSDGVRLQQWDRARRGDARIVIGTRSAIFTPLPDLGLIVVDEEHDESYKQQEGLRYSARDLALIRARDRDLPVVLGSATPSLESLHNAASGRYRHLRLRQRAGSAEPPRLNLIDLRRHPPSEGIAAPLHQAMADSLGAAGQVLVFLNRRGFAPVLRCSDCGWIAECPRCDARVTVHSHPASLRCHHCGYGSKLPPRCPSCHAPEPMPIGQGTQRSEAVLAQHFPGIPILRIDRDSTSSQQAFDQALTRIDRGDPAILIGTQMLAKGHHFPAVTLVAVLDADGGLFSADFRATERLAQQLLQVAGRAGRAERPGRVLIQTLQPEHPLWQPILDQDYHAFAATALAERRETGLPPYSHLALLRAEAAARSEVWALLQEASRMLQKAAGAAEKVAVLGPIPALRERVAGRYRAQLLLQSDERAPLHALLHSTLPALERLPAAKKIRWSLDVDPSDLT